MPTPVTFAAHQDGLDRMGRLIDPNAQPGAPIVSTLNGQDYCLVHLQLFTGAGGARELRGPSNLGTTDMFEDILRDAVLQHGAFVLHRRVLVVPLDGDSALAVAQAVWLTMVQAGATPNIPGSPQPRPNSWRAGDAVYVHYPADGGIAVCGAVIQTDGSMLPNWP